MPPHDAPPAVTAVISTRNRCAELKQTLGMLLPGREGWLRAVVVDNGSTDETAAMLKRDFPAVERHHQSENEPLRGYNLGFAAAVTPYVWVMDDDAVPAPGALEAMLKALEECPDMSAAAGNPIRSDGISEWTPLPLPDFTPHWYNLIGCGFMIRRDVLTRCGGYCESFDLYYNDLDLALRILAIGGHIAFSRDWVVEHRAATSTVRNRRKHVLMLRNFAFTIRNHCTGLRACSLLLPHTLKFLMPCLIKAGPRQTTRALITGLTAPPGRDRVSLPDSAAVRAFSNRYSLFGRFRRMIA